MTERTSDVVPDALTRLTQILIADEDVDSTLTRICRLATDAIATAECADVSLVIPGHGVQTRGSPDKLAQAVDLLQYETGEGPCLSSIDRQAIFRVDDMSTESRWPHFATRAAKETGVRSMLAFVLEVDACALAALNLFSTSTRAFDEGDEKEGLVFATQAATVLANATALAGAKASIQQLQDAMASRGVIGQAIGIIQGREGISKAQAIALLKKMSQHSNVKMKHVAETIVAKAEENPSAPSV